MFLFQKITKTKYGNKSIIQIDPIVLATPYYSIFSSFLYIYWLINEISFIYFPYEFLLQLQGSIIQLPAELSHMDACDT